MNVRLVAFGAVTLNVCVCKCFWCKCVKRKTIKKKMKNLHGNSSGTVKKLFPTLLKKKQTMYFITVT